MGRSLARPYDLLGPKLCRRIPAPKNVPQKSWNKRDAYDVLIVGSGPAGAGWQRSIPHVKVFVPV